MSDLSHSQSLASLNLYHLGFSACIAMSSNRRVSYESRECLMFILPSYISVIKFTNVTLRATPEL